MENFEIGKNKTSRIADSRTTKMTTWGKFRIMIEYLKLNLLYLEEFVFVIKFYSIVKCSLFWPHNSLL